MTEENATYVSLFFPLSLVFFSGRRIRHRSDHVPHRLPHDNSLLIYLCQRKQTNYSISLVIFTLLCLFPLRTKHAYSCVLLCAQRLLHLRMHVEHLTHLVSPLYTLYKYSRRTRMATNRELTRHILGKKRHKQRRMKKE